MREVWAMADTALPLAAMGGFARRAEAAGYDGVLVPDNVHDGFLASWVAIEATSRLRVGTAGVVAFARSPMTVALAAWDLQRRAEGRFHLGVGPLIKTIVVERYSVPWSAPAPRMREYIEALRAIFDCWQNGVPLRYVGEHYRFTRMQDFVKPPPLTCSPPEIFVAGIGPRMTALAGEMASGLVAHSTNSDGRFLREITLPALERGAQRTGRTRDDVVVIANPFCAVGKTDAEVHSQRERYRDYLGTLYSTREYAYTLDLHGWSDVGDRARRLIRDNRWDELGSVVSDELLDTEIIASRYDGLADEVQARFGGLADATTLPLPEDPSDDDRIANVIADLRR